MALPIARTPKLNAKETDKFLRDVETGLKNTVGYTPTPKLSEAKKAIRDYAMQPNARNSFGNDEWRLEKVDDFSIFIDLMWRQ